MYLTNLTNYFLEQDLGVQASGSCKCVIIPLFTCHILESLWFAPDVNEVVFPLFGGRVHVFVLRERERKDP